MLTKLQAEKIVAKLVKIKQVLCVQLDIGGLLNESAGATKLLYRIESVASKVRWLYEKEKIEFGVWEASRCQYIREQLAKKALHQFQEWDLMPRGHRPDKPSSEPKETEVKAIFKTSKEYSKRALSLLRAHYLCNLIEKAYAYPIRQRIMLLMSINKLNQPS